MSNSETPFQDPQLKVAATVEFNSQAIELLARASADEGSVYKGLGHMAAAGMLGALAADLGKLAEQVQKSGYVPPAKQAEYDYHDRLAKSSGLDRELARYHRDKAREIRAQLGE